MQILKKCPFCFTPMDAKTGKFGKFWSCPGCKKTADYAYSASAEGIKQYSPIDLSAIKLSEYQREILDFAKNQKENLIVNATAGSGKSFTLRLIAQQVPEHLRILYATFDKRSVEDIKHSLPDYVNASTWHSYGYKQIRTKFPNVQVNTKKNNEIFKEFNEKMGYREKQILSDSFFDILEIVSRAKNLLIENDFYKIIENANFEDEELCIDFVERIFRESVKRAETQVDFDDMIFIPATKRVPVKREHDLTLCDESQDLNPAQIELIKQACNRTIIVGDRNQAIYLFRGADSASMNLLQEHFKAHPLPLSITYRNPLNHVQYINGRFPEIPHEVNPDNNTEGQIGEILESDFLGSVQPGDLAICRVNAPLIPLCLSLIMEGKTAYVAGRNIGKNLVKFLKDSMKGAKRTDQQGIIDAVMEFATKQIWKMEAQGRSSNTIVDQRDCLLALAVADGVSSPKDVETKITRLFQDDMPGITLSTVHRAKGSEAENVYILAPNKMPLPKGDPQEERNILFVALTRAKQSMQFVLS